MNIPVICELCRAMKCVESLTDSVNEVAEALKPPQEEPDTPPGRDSGATK